MIRKKKADVFAVKRSKEDMDIKNIMGCAQVQTSCFCSLLHPFGTYELFLDVRSRKLLRKPSRSEAHRCYHSSSRVPFQRQKMPKIRCESERRTMSVGFAETLALWYKSIFVHDVVFVCVTHRSYHTFDIIRKVSTPCQPTPQSLQVGTSDIWGMSEKDQAAWSEFHTGAVLIMLSRRHFIGHKIECLKSPLH